MKYLLQRLKEPTTWVGFLALAAAFGLNVAPEHREVIIQGGIFFAGLIGILTRDVGDD